MESDGKVVEVLPTPQKRPASDEPAQDQGVGDGAAAKKVKPASSFSELASRAAKDVSGTVEAAQFPSTLATNRSSLVLGAAKKAESADSDHADSPAPPTLGSVRFSNSPVVEVRGSPLHGHFSLAPPMLAAPNKLAGEAEPVAAAAAVPSAVSAAGFIKPVSGSHLIKDFGFGPRPELDKAPKPTVPSENPFLQCLQKKPSPAPSSSASATTEDGMAASAGPPRFVFGQNLTDRAKVPSSTATSTSATNGASSAVTPSSEPASAATASSSAAQDLPLVDVVTGEEDEKNVIQISCRLYNFNRGTRQWVERGRGILRLNDKDTSSGPPTSRLVVRASGSLRVMVNCCLWPGQSCEKVNMKSARLTVMSAGGELEIVLIKASAVEIADLVTHVNKRLNALKNEKQLTEASPPAFTLPAALSKSDSTTGDEKDTEEAEEKEDEQAEQTSKVASDTEATAESTSGESKGDESSEAGAEETE